MGKKNKGSIRDNYDYESDSDNGSDKNKNESPGPGSYLDEKYIN